MQIRESAEDYLEAILVLSRKGGGGKTDILPWTVMEL